MRALTTWWLGALLCLSVILMWVLGRWINPTLFEAGLFLAICVWAGRMMWRPWPVMWSVGLLPLIAAVLWGVAQLAWRATVGQWETQNATVGWAANLAAFWLAMQLGAEKKARGRLLGVMLVFGFGISLVSVLQFFSAPNRVFWMFVGFGESFGPFESRDRYAAFAELLLPIAIARGLGDGRMGRFALGAAATLFAAVIAGASRAGAVLITGETLAVLWAAGQSGMVPMPRVRGVAAKFGILAAVFTAVVGAGVLLSRFDTSDPYAGRREYVQSSVAMVRDRPWTGFGLGNFENVYGGYALVDLNKIVNHAHNDWAEWAVDGGLPFLAFLVGFAGWAAPRAWRSVWGIGVVVVLLHSLVDFPMQSPVIAFWVFSLAGLIAGNERPLRQGTAGSGLWPRWPAGTTRLRG